MSKFGNFLNGDDDYASPNDEIILGEYGCSVCELDVQLRRVRTTMARYVLSTE